MTSKTFLFFTSQKSFSLTKKNSKFFKVFEIKKNRFYLNLTLKFLGNTQDFCGLNKEKKSNF